jgi:hypothetical protein
MLGIAESLVKEAKILGWKRSEIKMASTGTIYIEFVRDGKEWVVIRIANHKQFYHRWITTYSLSPCENSFDDIINILSRPFGKVGDVLL